MKHIPKYVLWIAIVVTITVGIQLWEKYHDLRALATVPNFFFVLFAGNWINARLTIPNDDGQAYLRQQVMQLSLVGAIASAICIIGILHLFSVIYS